ncbi:MAG: membrane protein insertase YidC [Acidimicrobiaceae bacterium]|nr:membrane protein insertase YidC [Acidimicrobiaceae bacterium]
MNSRLFLYSSLFFVLILLFDASSRPPAESLNNKESEVLIPETTESSENASDYIIEPMLKDRKQTQSGLRYVDVITDTHKLKISLTDGSIVSAELLNYAKEFESIDNNVKLLSNSGKKYIAKTNVQSKDVVAPNNYQADRKLYDMGDSDVLEIVLKGETNGQVAIQKTYRFGRDSHLIEVEQLVQNLLPSTTSWRQFNTLERGDEEEGNVMLYTYTGAAYYDDDDKFNKIEFSDIRDSNFLKETSQAWISMIQHYFFTAWLPETNTQNKQTIYTRFSTNDHGDSYLIGTVSDYKSILPRETHNFKSRLYVGPKDQEEITDLANGLDLTVDYGVLTFLAAPLFWVLNKIYLIFGNWGWSIIALTVLIKLLFFKLSETSYKSMAKMKKLTPRMNALKERFGDDRQKFSEALMKVYKEEKVNPLGGCLPILIQIPVFIALYWVLIESVEMRHAPFVWWIVDLSSSDPLYILPILMGISMYVQQKLNPAPTDEMQKKYS